VEDLKTEFMCNAFIDVDWKEILDLGATPHGTRQIIYLKGGHFEGPKVRGVVLPGGGDWLIRRNDGVLETDVRATVRTDDNHKIYTYFRGIIDMPLDVAIKLISGEAVDSSKYYYRVTPLFETSSEKYAWLNRIVTVGVGSLTPTGTTYKVYTIL
jgi:hypothetical protein